MSQPFRDLSIELGALAGKISADHHGRTTGRIQQDVEFAVESILKAKSYLARASRLAGEPQPPFEGVA